MTSLHRRETSLSSKVYAYRRIKGNNETRRRLTGRDVRMGMQENGMKNGDPENDEKDILQQNNDIDMQDVTDRLNDYAVDDVPLELVEGLLPDEASRPKFDLDVDESMLMWKVRRMLHEEDYKKIFDNPRVGEV